MQYLLVFICTMLFCIGMVKFLPDIFSKFCRHSVRQLDILVDKDLEDSDKQSKLVSNLKGLLSNMLLLFVGLIVLIALSIIPILLYQYFTKNTIDTSSSYFYLSMLLGSLILLKKPQQKSDYSYWSKLIHYLALDNYKLSKILFNRETKKIDKLGIETNEHFVIISGLARAGTTALTTSLFEKGMFHSLNYSNMPFLLAPKMWEKIYKEKGKQAKQRAHGDKVLVRKNSVEALEEYFFKVFTNDTFIHDESLSLHKISDNTYEAYLKYQRNIGSKSTDSVYLAKNNNLILRYESLRSKNAEFKSIFLFREPINHANSLLRQHLNFIKQQEEDDFVKDYMNWLGHYEFGMNQKVFDFGLEDKWSRYDKTSLNYWLAIWVNYYGYLKTMDTHHNLILCDYEDFLEKPNTFLPSLYQKLDLSINHEAKTKFLPNKHDIDTSSIDQDLLFEAENLYIELKSKKFNA